MISASRSTPIASADGTQIWKITHNGVDTHPLHWHLYDVQVLNRVTWDNIISPPDPSELGWKDTLRVSPLEDTYVALRPIIPQLPFELPNSIRPLHPMIPIGSTIGFNNVDADGNPTTPIVNQLVNFGWEYVWHCHILSHEEMDMMRPVAVAMPPNEPSNAVLTKSGSKVTVTFTDNSITETSFQLQRTEDSTTWTNVGTPLVSPLDVPNTTNASLALTDSGVSGNPGPVYGYRVAAVNTVGYGGAFPTISAQSVSEPTVFSGDGNLPAAPTNLTASLASGPRVNLSWTDTATNENGFVIQRSSDGVTFTQIGTAPAGNNTVTFADPTVVVGNTYTYQVAAVNGAGLSYSNMAIVSVSAPTAPLTVIGSAVRQGNNERVTLLWTNSVGSNNQSGFEIQGATDIGFTAVVYTGSVGANVTIITTGNLPRVDYYFRVRAVNPVGQSAWVNAVPFPIPPAP